MLRGGGVVIALAMVAVVTLTFIGSLGQNSLQVHRSFSGVRVVDVHVVDESVVIRPGGDARVRLDRTIVWSMSRPATTQRMVGDHLVVRSSSPSSFALTVTSLSATMPGIANAWHTTRDPTGSRSSCGSKRPITLGGK